MILISAAHWSFLETLVYRYIPILLASLTILSFVIIFIVLYKNGRKAKLVLSLCAIFIALLSLFLFLHNKYAEEMKQLEKTSPAIQYKKRKFGGYDYYPQYQPKLMDEPLIKDLNLYKAEPIEASDGITFVGKTEHLYYFKIGNILYRISKSSPYVHFTPEVKTETFVGEVYTLIDSDFEELGFYNKTEPLFKELLIPIELESLEFEHNGEPTKNYNFEYIEKEEGP